MASIERTIGRLLSFGSRRSSSNVAPCPAELSEKVRRIELSLNQVETTRPGDIADLEKRLSRVRGRLVSMGATIHRPDRYENVVQGLSDLLVLVSYGDEDGEESFLERAEQLVGFVEFELPAS